MAPVTTALPPGPSPGAASDPGLLALHGVRILGYASAAVIGARFGVAADVVENHLREAESHGWAIPLDDVDRVGGWRLTDGGRLEDERLLAEELDRTGLREVVVAAHQEFLPLNRRMGRAATDWQIKPTPWDPMSMNDHADYAWDEGVIRALVALAADLRRVTDPLEAALARFAGHAEGYRTALGHVLRGDYAWIDGPDRASCHLVWIQLHEDLLATLGIPRGSDT